jgi:hypothetical protein
MRTEREGDKGIIPGQVQTQAQPPIGATSPPTISIEAMPPPGRHFGFYLAENLFVEVEIFEPDTAPTARLRPLGADQKGIDLNDGAYARLSARRVGFGARLPLPAGSPSAAFGLPTPLLAPRRPG